MPAVTVPVIDVLSSSDDESGSESPAEHPPDRKKNFGKSRRNKEKFDEDCYILDFDPESIDFSLKISLDDTIELAFISEKGPVAVRDFPHSRHLCVKFPFATTPHETHCDQCYCYVCDQVAPCTQWKVVSALKRPHCDATDTESYWTAKRRIACNPAKRAAPGTIKATNVAAF